MFSQHMPSPIHTTTTSPSTPADAVGGAKRMARAVRLYLARGCRLCAAYVVADSTATVAIAIATNNTCAIFCFLLSFVFFLFYFFSFFIHNPFRCMCAFIDLLGLKSLSFPFQGRQPGRAAEYFGGVIVFPPEAGADGLFVHMGTKRFQFPVGEHETALVGGEERGAFSGGALAVVMRLRVWPVVAPCAVVDDSQGDEVVLFVPVIFLQFTALAPRHAHGVEAFLLCVSERNVLRREFHFFFFFFLFLFFSFPFFSFSFFTFLWLEV
jgi:hypothetical protein